MTNYTEASHMCRVDVFRTGMFSGRPSKWYLTEAVSFEGLYDELVNTAFKAALARHFQGRCGGMIAICPDPCSKYSYPWADTIPRQGEWEEIAAEFAL